MRADIDIDDDDLAVVMQRYRLATETGAVALALRRLAGRPMTREEALAMRGHARSTTSLPISRRAGDPRRHLGVVALELDSGLMGA